MTDVQQDRNCYLNRDKTTCVQVVMDKDDVIQIMLVSTILKLSLVPGTQTSPNQITPPGQPGSLTDYKRENRFLKLPYGIFLKDVLHNIIQGYKLIKAGKTDHKVLLNHKKPDGLTIQVMTSASGRVCLDIR